MGRQKVIVSAGVVCYINNQPFGRVKDFQWNSSTPHNAIHGIDALEPFELVPAATKVTGRLTIYRTVSDSGIEGVGMTTQYAKIPREKYFTLQLVERTSDTVIFESKYCSVISQTWTAPEKGLVTGTVEFEGLDWSNEKDSFRF